MENTARVIELDRHGVENMVNAAKVLDDAKKHREVEAIEKIKKQAAERSERGAMRIVANLMETGESSTLTIKVKVSYSKENDGEVIVTTRSVTNLPDETSEERGEILDGQLKIW